VIIAERPTPFFIADDRALDFLNSVACPWGSEIEWLRDGSDLLAWLDHADLVPEAVLKCFSKEGKGLDAVATEARELRKWFRAFVGKHAGRPLPSSILADLDPINRLLARDETFSQIEAGSSGDDLQTSALRWRRERRWHSADALLLPIAEAMGDSICQADFAHVRLCEGSTCTVWFHDISKNHTRRWCSMAVCGNRAKAAAHRAKKRSARRA
jgi:predicted RNA-binding Zn ribbon-like protein